MTQDRYDHPCYTIDRIAVEGVPRAYVLGCRAQRVTVLSQQYRAFNLIWALFADGRLKPGDRVGVIGGGIGGLTVRIHLLTGIGAKGMTTGPALARESVERIA